jgi:hypothetical protein
MSQIFQSDKYVGDLLFVKKHFCLTIRSNSHYPIPVQDKYSLVVQNGVRSPDTIIGNADYSNSSEFRDIPFQMMVGPDLRNPTVGREYLVLFILQ